MRKSEAVAKLAGLGWTGPARKLSQWRSCTGTDQGWDGWMRLAYPDLAHLVVRNG